MSRLWLTLPCEESDSILFGDTSLEMGLQDLTVPQSQVLIFEKWIRHFPQTGRFSSHFNIQVSGTFSRYRIYSIPLFCEICKPCNLHLTSYETGVVSDLNECTLLRIM